MLRQSLLALVRRPLLSGGIISTLGLALAATLLVLGLLDSYLLRPLPFGDATRIVSIHEYPLSTGPGSLWRMTFGNAADIHDRVTTLSRTAIIRNEAFTARTPGGTEVAFVQRVSPEYFPMLGVRAAVGETITPANAEVDGLRALVLAHDFWQRRFGGDRAVIGQTLQLDHQNYRIVGVMPPDLTLPLVGDGQQGWIALLPVDFHRQDRAVRRHFMIGELASGRTLASAKSELSALAATLAREFPATNADRGLTAVSLREAILGSFERQLYLLQAAVALVLIVACVNAGCLLLAQAIRRRREFAVRLALGAGARDLLRQFFLESLWLSLAAAALGLLLAAWFAPLTTELLPPNGALRQLPAPTIGWQVVAGAAGLAVCIATVFSLVPLWQAQRLNLESTLRDGSRQLGSVSGAAATRLLVSLQVAVALALLITAVQLVRSFHAVQHVDRGMPVEQLHTFRLGTRGEAYRDAAARTRYYEGVVEELKKLPHVAAGGIVDFALPAVPTSYLGFVQEGDGLTLGETPKRATRRSSSVGLLETLQLKLHAGRWLSADDRAGTRQVVVINQSLADKYWPNRDALGRRVQIEGTEGWWEIVGIVSDTLSHGSQPKVVDSFYLPHTQHTPWDTGVMIRVRGTQPLSREQIDRAVATLEPESTAYFAFPVATFFANSAWQTRFSLTLVGIFAGLAVALCLMGVYAVLAFAVAGRTSEFGVRLALGSSRAEIARLVLRDAARMTVPGLIVGLLLAALASRSVSNLIYGVAAVDAPIYLATLLTLAVACAAACLVPSWRAARVDPLVALRTE